MVRLVSFKIRLSQIVQSLLHVLHLNMQTVLHQLGFGSFTSRLKYIFGKAGNPTRFWSRTS